MFKERFFIFQEAPEKPEPVETAMAAPTDSKEEYKAQKDRVDALKTKLMSVSTSLPDETKDAHRQLVLDLGKLSDDLDKVTSGEDTDPPAIERVDRYLGKLLGQTKEVLAALEGKTTEEPAESMILADEHIPNTPELIEKTSGDKAFEELTGAETGKELGQQIAGTEDEQLAENELVTPEDKTEVKQDVVETIAGINAIGKDNPLENLEGQEVVKPDDGVEYAGIEDAVQPDIKRPGEEDVDERIAGL